MAIESDKALLCERKLRRALSFFEAPGDLSVFGGARFKFEFPAACRNAVEIYPPLENWEMGSNLDH